MESDALVQIAFMCRLAPLKSMVFRVIMLSISENNRVLWKVMLWCRWPSCAG
jgi:hypothetical protein